LKIEFLIDGRDLLPQTETHFGIAAFQKSLSDP